MARASHPARFIGLARGAASPYSCAMAAGVQTQRIELRPARVHSVFLLLGGVILAFIGVGFVSDSPDADWFAWAILLGGIGTGLYGVIRFADRRPRVVIDDRGVHGNVSVLFADMAEVTLDHVIRAGAKAELVITKTDGKVVRIDIENLDMPVHTVHAHVCERAQRAGAPAVDRDLQDPES